MYMRKKSTAVAMCAVVSATSLCFGLAGCLHERPEQYYDPDTFAEFGNEVMLTLMGSDVMSWNSLSVTPEQSYGYERYGELVFLFAALKERRGNREFCIRNVQIRNEKI